MPAAADLQRSDPTVPVHAAFRPCILIPTYDNPKTIRSVVEQAREYLEHVVVIDDGSGPEGANAVDALARDGLAHVHRRPSNGGKGAAVKTGFEVAAKLGFSHALQVDADGQHELEDIPRFLDQAREDPAALVLGAPVFDASAPRGRLIGREVTRFWTHIEAGSTAIDDPMCGFRVYPLASATTVDAGANGMDFDIEIAVRMVWAGTRTINLPTRVSYVAPADGGVSHFRMWGDNLRISWLHTKLVNIAMYRRVRDKVLRWLRLAP